MLRKFYIVLCAVLLTAGALRAQQIAPRIAGLEGNAEYMSLLGEERQLQIREDSIVKAVDRLREQLREQPEQRQHISQDILRLESRIFEARNAKGRLVDRINAIEQEWVFANLNNPEAHPAEPIVPPGGAVAVPDSLKVRNLVDNLYLREHLPSQDYAALQKAQQMEMQAVDLVNRYFANHAQIVPLAEQYAAVQTEAEALEIQDKYSALQGLNRVLADSLSATWNYIFDNKSYAYTYLLEELGRDQLLSHEEEQVAAAARRLSALRGQTASDEVVDYFVRKVVLVDYEATVAGALRLDAARDSLLGVAAQLKDIDFRLPRAEVQERYFLDYAPLKFSRPTIYNAQNPIPECRVFQKGTIYRVLLGTFTAKRPVSVFRNTEPLCYLVGEDGKWRYYAGGFATREEVLDAQAQLKAKGFLRPEIAVWTDGVYYNLSRDPEALASTYRVEISSTEDLSDAVKAAITAAAEGRELSRVGQQLFVVGLFEDQAAADRVADAIRLADGALEIKVAEIAE